MTSPAEPAPHDAAQVRQLTRPLRELAALVLLGANAVLLFVGFVDLLTPANEYSTFPGRAGSGFFTFVGIEAIALPLLAVLLATHVSPVVRRAKQITQVAVAEYAVSALLGALALLIWLVGRLAEVELLRALLGMLTRAAWFAVFGVAAFVVYRIWRTFFHTPKPQPQPGMYGQPQPGWPQQPAPGTFPTAGYPPPGQSGYPAAGGPYGSPSAPPFGSPSGTVPPFGSPSGTVPPFGSPSAPSFGAAPQSAPPFSGPNTAPPFGQPPSADPTQAIPRQPGEAGAPPATQGGEDNDQTQSFRRDDPQS
ncbi:hypothetical protein E1193_26480 [Micromonospora sp. KC606]|uniref:hypothetical protein n=1 Tax=Micromonospora sp. KC606 TaxID=2530379 RepID=UPI00104AD2DB|nr:hypothetical protein [Micromonospora sp. KC606]TDC73022.1 hypothetical protein E1193_26480 [Micromonospora sp. KC606]